MSPISEDRYHSEEKLQNLISEYPGLLDGNEMDTSKNKLKDKSWLLVTREYDINRDSGGNWSVDHLFLDEDGVPTFVEVKLLKDPRSRRKVVGQMLDYVSHSWAHGADLHGRFVRKYGGETAIERVADLIGVDYDDRDSIRKFWDGVNEKLQTGHIRILFAADRIRPELRSIIEFLNEQMPRAEVFGVEIKRYSDDNYEILVPSLLGDTSKSKKGKTSYNTTLKNIIESDDMALSEGDVIYMSYEGNQYTATVCENGKVNYDGEKTSLSGAARSVTGTRRNGWECWETEDGIILDMLRDKYRSNK